MHLCHMYSRMYINAYTITRGLVIFHVGKCVKDVRTGLQNTSSCFVDEAISLSLSPPPPSPSSLSIFLNLFLFPFVLLILFLFPDETRV